MTIPTNAQSSTCPRKWHAYSPTGLWHAHGSPNLGQKTRPYNNQQKKKKRIYNIVDFAVPNDHRIKLKKLWNMKTTIVPIVIGAFGTVTEGSLKGLEDWKLADEWRPSKRQHFWRRTEYWEESWRLDESCCHSNSSERPSANVDVKNSKRFNNNNNNNNNNDNVQADLRIKLKKKWKEG